MLYQSIAPIALLSVLAIASTTVGQGSAPIDPLNVRQLASEADQAMNAGEFDRAIELWDVLRDRLPQSPEVPYNMGVAAYRYGDYTRAAELFAQALSMTSDQELRSDSAYNLGTSAYAQSLAADSNLSSPAAGEQLDQATSELQRALEYYRQTLDLSPNDADARANAELAYRRLQNLEAMKRQLQQTDPQQQQPQNLPSDDQSDQQQQQQPQDQDQQSDDNQQQQNNPQQNQQDPQQNQDNSDQQSSQSNSEQQQPDEQSQPQPSPDQQPPTDEDNPPLASVEPENDDADDSENSSPPRDSDREGMSRDEAERLLQLVRDKQRQRQQQRKREQASRLPPVDKDW